MRTLRDEDDDLYGEPTVRTSGKSLFIEFFSTSVLLCTSRQTNMILTFWPLCGVNQYPSREFMFDMVVYTVA